MSDHDNEKNSEQQPLSPLPRPKRVAGSTPPPKPKRDTGSPPPRPKRGSRSSSAGRSRTLSKRTLVFGGVGLLCVVVLAAVGIGVLPRLAWLAVMVVGSFLVHVAGVALLGRGLIWAAGTDSPDGPARLVLSLFAVYWGLLPPVVGGLWCFAYWLPRVRIADATRSTSNRNASAS